MFEPIAIVGRSCILPNADSPEKLWDHLIHGRDLLSDAPVDRWRIDMSQALGDSGKDCSWTDRGGYVKNDVIFGAEKFQGLDPLFHWAAHCASEVFKSIPHVDPSRVDLYLANLSFPSESMSKYCESQWFSALGVEREGGDERNLMMSGLPAMMIADELGIGQGFALDAACASALYALKLGATRLALKEVDAVLVGAINRADPLFIHHGFTALNALSKTGQSRPFHPQADGLVPSEGCVFLALKRASDVTEDDSLLGVIRGIGLSNDGRSKGFLAPSAKGQIRSMKNALKESGLEADQIEFVECHATGTQLGDATEIDAMKAVYSRTKIGSHKSNLGHSITVSGLVATLKVLGIFEHQLIPPTIHCAEQDFGNYPMEVVQNKQTFDGDYSAISAFGFGGNNAHMILQSADSWFRDKVNVPTKLSSGPLQIVGLDVRIGNDVGLEAITKNRKKTNVVNVVKDIDLALNTLRFPPHDLLQTTRQQLLVLKGAQNLIENHHGDLDPTRTGVFIGMACDADVTRFGARWRAQEAGLELSDLEVPFAPLLRSPGVIGTMPNVVANRLNTQFDFSGPSFTVSSNLLSGMDAWECARLLIASGDIDTAIVGAVSTSNLVTKHTNDLEEESCILFLVASEEALRKEDSIASVSFRKTKADVPSELARLDPSASMRVFLDELTLATSYRCDSDSLHKKERTVSQRVGSQTRTMIIEPQGHLQREVDAYEILLISGKDREDILRKLKRGERDEGNLNDDACLTILHSGSDLETRLQEAMLFLQKGSTSQSAGIKTKGIYFYDSALKGDLAFVYTGSAAPYPRLLNDWLTTARSLVDPIFERVGLANAAKHLDWSFDGKALPSPESQIWSVSLMSQIQTLLSKDVFGLKPDAAIGFSLGESTMLFALGAWTDLQDMVEDLPASKIFSEALTGSYFAVQQARKESGFRTSQKDEKIWENWTISGPLNVVEDLVVKHEFVHISIIHTDAECVISGDPKACSEIIDVLRAKKNFFVSKQVYDVAIHVPEVAGIADAYKALHHRPVRKVDHVRFYSNATNASYTLSQERCSQMILEQAMTTLNFPKTIRQAYADGVRVFLEHGPRALCSKWIKHILGDLPFVALSLDSFGGDLGRHWFEVAAELMAAGVQIDLDALNKLLRKRPIMDEKRTIAFPPWANAQLKQQGVQAWKRPERIPNQPLFKPFTKEKKSEGMPLYVHQKPTDFVELVGGFEIESIQTPADAHAFFLHKQQEVYQTFLSNFVESQNLLVQFANYGTGIEVQTASTPIPLPAQTVHVAEIAPQIKTKPPKKDSALSREELEFMSYGSIQEILGEKFAPLDDYDVVVRMPRPPLLLADRVMEIDAVPASMGRGRIRTETDVVKDAWYLHCGRMPAGIMIEAGQADLLLVSYLGVDLLNKGERAYRLLGCKLTYGNGLPAIGETLKYDIAIDGFAKHGDVRLFFFHYDCVTSKNTGGDEMRLQVRDGQAGFFTDTELAESGGVLWTPEEAEFDSNLAFEKGEKESKHTSFSSEQFDAFAEGDIYGCFGEEFAYGATHTRTPGIWNDIKHRFLDSVVELDFCGGPLGRGYMRAETKITSTDWYFDGHFHNDPCMPGTLMFEGCLQAMSFFFAARGDTLTRDGWRAEPVPGMEFEMICRGQATPENEHLDYEIFIESAYLSAEGYPTLIADLLVTVDGLKAFHCRRMAMRLVPDWPMTTLLGTQETTPSKTCTRPIPFDYPEMLATAIGRPSTAFGSLYKDFDGTKKAPRLPGPPYHFMTRVEQESGENSMKAGAKVVVEYDVPDDAWYFEHNQEMPYAVLLEAGLQPCGWLASWVGCAVNTKSEVYFRNLDGEGEIFSQVLPTDSVITTEVELTKLVRSGDTTLVGFDVEMSVDGRPLYSLSTMFGFFPAEALASQAGLVAEEIPSLVDKWEALPNIESKKLTMIDEFQIRGDEQTRIFARRKFHASDWFFKAHFFQDPVQPGSLGLEAMIQCLKIQAHKEYGHSTFSTLLNHRHEWSYRGQVRPKNQETMVDVRLKKADEEQLIGEGFLWVDGASIYRFSGFGIKHG